MTLCFMAILAVVVEERVSARLGPVLLWPLLATGLLSLSVWLDRRFVALRLGRVLSRSCHAVAASDVPAQIFGHGLPGVAAALYALAKLFEFYDHAVHANFILRGIRSSISPAPTPVSRC
jgi:hypothetical protein